MAEETRRSPVCLYVRLIFCVACDPVLIHQPFFPKYINTFFLSLFFFLSSFLFNFSVKKKDNNNNNIDNPSVLLMSHPSLVHPSSASSSPGRNRPLPTQLKCPLEPTGLDDHHTNISTLHSLCPCPRAPTSLSSPPSLPHIADWSQYRNFMLLQSECLKRLNEYRERIDMSLRATQSFTDMHNTIRQAVLDYLSATAMCTDLPLQEIQSDLLAFLSRLNERSLDNQRTNIELGDDRSLIETGLAEPVLGWRPEFRPTLSTLTLACDDESVLVPRSDDEQEDEKDEEEIDLRIRRRDPAPIPEPKRRKTSPSSSPYFSGPVVSPPNAGPHRTTGNGTLPPLPKMSPANCEAYQRSLHNTSTALAKLNRYRRTPARDAGSSSSSSSLQNRTLTRPSPSILFTARTLPPSPPAKLAPSPSVPLLLRRQTSQEASLEAERSDPIDFTQVEEEMSNAIAEPFPSPLPSMPGTQDDIQYDDDPDGETDVGHSSSDEDGDDGDAYHDDDEDV